MGAEELLEKYAEDAGWNDASKLVVLCRYIDNQGDNTSFRDFLIEQVREELGGE